MTEIEFWAYLNMLLSKGRMDMRMGMLLFCNAGPLRTKQAVLILLAHHPSQEALAILEKFSLSPDRGLRIFSELALDECRMWNDEKAVTKIIC
jgi:hypothetical protein